MASVEQLLRQHCPLISEEFLPDLLSKLRQNDVCTSMLLACELTDQDLQDIGTRQQSLISARMHITGYSL